MRQTLVVLLAALSTLVWSGVALADATPIELVLLYMPNVSTTGTPTASGTAELVMPEGEFRISATGLPRLDGDKQYVAWVVNTNTNEFQRLGAFNTSESTGSVHYENVLPDAIPNKHWNLLLVTVENSDAPGHPSTRHSIAGVFPDANNQELPGVLPNTGGDPDADYLPPPSGPDWTVTSGLAALTLALGSGAGYVLGKKTR